MLAHIFPMCRTGEASARPSLGINFPSHASFFEQVPDMADVNGDVTVGFDAICIACGECEVIRLGWTGKRGHFAESCAISSDFCQERLLHRLIDACVLKNDHHYYFKFRNNSGFNFNEFL